MQINFVCASIVEIWQVQHNTAANSNRTARKIVFQRSATKMLNMIFINNKLWKCFGVKTACHDKLNFFATNVVSVGEKWLSKKKFCINKFDGFHAQSLIDVLLWWQRFIKSLFKFIEKSENCIKKLIEAINLWAAFKFFFFFL